MTEPEPLQQIGRTYVCYRGRKLSYFSGCDYFRLASHPEVIAAMRAGLKHYGLNVAASRLTTGNHPIYRELEAGLCSFFAAENAVLVTCWFGIGSAHCTGPFEHADISFAAASAVGL